MKTCKCCNKPIPLTSKFDYCLTCEVELYEMDSEKENVSFEKFSKKKKGWV